MARRFLPRLTGSLWALALLTGCPSGEPAKTTPDPQDTKTPQTPTQDPPKTPQRDPNAPEIDTTQSPPPSAEGLRDNRDELRRPEQLSDDQPLPPPDLSGARRGE